jgi:hypothetical protein
MIYKEFAYSEHRIALTFVSYRRNIRGLRTSSADAPKDSVCPKLVLRQVHQSLNPLGEAENLNW